MTSIMQRGEFTVDVRTITFDGIDCYDGFDVVVKDGNVGFPTKTKNRIKIPNTNIFYDYAELFGDQYEERALEYTLLIAEPNAMTGQEIQHKKMLLANWLMPGSQHKLEDSNIPGYYFLAEIQSAPSLEDLFTYGELTVQFACYPYKIGGHLEGDDVWDTFDFDTDIAQDLSFDVNGSQSVSIYNVSAHSIESRVVVTGNVSVSLNGTTIELNNGTFGDVGLVLNVDKNVAQLSGNGTIRFEFRKEVL